MYRYFKRQIACRDKSGYHLTGCVEPKNGYGVFRRKYVILQVCLDPPYAPNYEQKVFFEKFVNPDEYRIGNGQPLFPRRQR